MSYRLSPLSVRDLDEIGSYVGDRSVRAAIRLIDAFQRQFELLSERPRIGRARPDLRPELRSWPHGSYIVLYRVIEGGVEIVRVVHGARDLVSVLNEESPGNGEQGEI